MPLYTYNDDIIINDGKLANDSACCCSSVCENDASVGVIGVGAWTSTTHTVPFSGTSCSWEADVPGGCGGLGATNRIILTISCSELEGGEVQYVVDLVENPGDDEADWRGARYRLIQTGSGITDCTEQKTLDFITVLSGGGTEACGSYAGTTVTVGLANNSCCTCCSSPCCGFNINTQPETVSVEITASTCPYLVGMTITLLEYTDLGTDKFWSGSGTCSGPVDDPSLQSGTVALHFWCDDGIWYARDAALDAIESIGTLISCDPLEVEFTDVAFWYFPGDDYVNCCDGPNHTISFTVT